MDIKEIPYLPERLSGLRELASNLWWSWHPGARMLFKMLDRQVWKESRHNPVKVLKELPKETFDLAAADKDYLRHYDIVLSRFHKEIKGNTCLLLEEIKEAKIHSIVYFSAEMRDVHKQVNNLTGIGVKA
jgi:glycogen phosphorylase